MGRYQFMSFTKGFGFIKIASVLPGSNLYRFMRYFGGESAIGRYVRLELDPGSEHFGYHLFERGIVKITHIHNN